jgi:MFS transporter, PAT family, beta-lactamase induction signal transducer AmpG
MAEQTLKRPRIGIADFKDRNLLGIFMLGFSASAPIAIATSILAIWLRQAGVSNAEIGLTSLVMLPVALKVLWAPLLDWARLGRFADRFGQRRSMILVMQSVLIGLVMLVGQINPAAGITPVLILVTLVMIVGVSIDTLAHALRIDVIPTDRVAIGTAMMTLGQRLGLTAAGAAALAIAAELGWGAAYATIGLLGITGLFGAVLMTEQQRDPADRAASFNWRTWWAPFKEFLTRPGAWLILGWIFFARFGDSLAFTMLFPMLVDLGFTNNEISFAQNAIGMIGLLLGLPLGVAIYNGLGIKRALVVTMIIMAGTNLNMTWLAYAGHDVFILNLTMGLESLTGSIGAVVIMSYLSALCNLRYSATQYAMLIALSAGARALLAAPAGILMEAVGYPTFFTISVFAAIPGLILLWFMARRDELFDFDQQSQRT